MHEHGDSTIYFHNMESHCAGMHGSIHINGWTCAAEEGKRSIKCASPRRAPYGGGGLDLRLSDAQTRYVTHRGDADARAPARVLPILVQSLRVAPPPLLYPRTSPPPASRAEAATAGAPAVERPFVLHRRTLTRSILPTRGTEGESFTYVL